MSYAGKNMMMVSCDKQEYLLIEELPKKHIGLVFLKLLSDEPDDGDISTEDMLWPKTFKRWTDTVVITTSYKSDVIAKQSYYNSVLWAEADESKFQTCNLTTYAHSTYKDITPDIKLELNIYETVYDTLIVGREHKVIHERVNRQSEMDIHDGATALSSYVPSVFDDVLALLANNNILIYTGVPYIIVKYMSPRRTTESAFRPDVYYVRLLDYLMTKSFFNNYPGLGTKVSTKCMFASNDSAIIAQLGINPIIISINP